METVFDLLNELEETLDNSRAVPFSNRVSVDKEELYEIITEIRMKLPNELKQSKWVIEERNKILIDAQKEADEILSLEPFQVPVTDDAKNRRRMYQEEAERKKIKMVFNGSDADFIKSCKMVIRITQAGEDTEKRCLELVQRTNQLNLSGKKYEAEGFHKLLDDHAGSCFAIFCRDRYRYTAI